MPMGPLSRLIRFLNRRFPKTYAALSLAPRMAIAAWWMRKLERERVGKRLSRLDFGKRTSDRIFILGTGASINEYPEEWWRLVRHHDSVSMNFFLLHEHVPTYHMMEDVRGIRARLLQQRYEVIGDYREVPLIMKTQLTNLSYQRVRARVEELESLPRPVRDNIYLSLDVLAAGSSDEAMRLAYRNLDRLGLWKPKDHFTMLTKRRGSVSYAINFAVRAGYTEIVLCGIDLNHTEYFYDGRRAEIEARGLTVPINDQPGVVHSTNDPEVNPVTIQQVILGIRDEILTPHGVRLLIANESSALHPDLPLFDWQGAVEELADTATSPPQVER